MADNDPVTDSLNGAHIRIGFYKRDGEVNGLQLTNVHMSEYQKHSIAIDSRTQAISINGGSLENIGGSRLFFATKTQRNTFVLNNVDIERKAIGNVTADNPIDINKVYLVEGIDGDDVQITCSNCMFRLGDSSPEAEGFLGKNATIIIDDGFGNSPMVRQKGLNTKVDYKHGRNIYFRDSNYQPVTRKNENPLRGAIPPVGFDVLNTIEPRINNFISHTDTAYKAVFCVYIGSEAALRMLSLTLKTVVKSKTENDIQGVEEYRVAITTPFAVADPNNGIIVTKVIADVSP